MTLFKNLIFLLSSFFYRNNKSKVIYYHDIHDVKVYTPMSTALELFRQHMLILKKEYTIVDEISKETGEVLICFDDGFKGIYDCKDFIIENNIYVRIFLISDFIGKENYLTKAQILELNSHSNFAFGAHTHTHSDLGTMSNSQIKYELSQCKNELENLLNEEITHLCFPRGRFSNSTLELSSQFGYQYLYASIPGNYFTEKEKGIICRYLVQHDPPSSFKRSLNGAQNILKSKRLKQHFNPLN